MSGLEQYPAGATPFGALFPGAPPGAVAVPEIVASSVTVGP